MNGMKMKRHGLIAGAVAVACALGAALPAAATERCRIKAELERSGSDADAGGVAKASMSATRARLRVRLSRLTPGATYSFTVGGTEHATFTATATGRGNLRFQQPPRTRSLPLDFDPRGEDVALIDDSGSVLHAVFSGTGEPDGILVDERTSLTPTALAPGGKAEARFRRDRDGRTRFSVEIEDVAAGAYELFVDGIFRAPIIVDSVSGEGEVEFDSNPQPPELLLDFDPRGLVVDVVQGGGVFFSGVMAARSDGVNVCTFTENEEPLVSTGIDADATGKARLRTRDDCDRDFRVEIQDVPLGDYEISVGGMPRGIITVVFDAVEARNEGQIEFDTDPDEPGEVLLDFDPTGALVEISQGATVFFSGVFTGTGGTSSGSGGSGDDGSGGSGSGGGGSGGGGGTCQFSETEVPLLNSGVVASAKGKARFRVRDDCEEDLRVEIEDLPVGSYQLLVDGIDRGTIAVAFNAAEGQNEGQIEFDTDPDQPDEVLLDFDPRGALLEVVQGGSVFLSRVFPDA